MTLPSGFSRAGQLLVSNSVDSLQAGIAKEYTRLFVILALLMTLIWVPTTIIFGRKPFDKRLEENENGIEWSEENKWAFYLAFLFIGLHIFNLVIRGILR